MLQFTFQLSSLHKWPLQLTQDQCIIMYICTSGLSPFVASPPVQYTYIVGRHVHTINAMVQVGVRSSKFKQDGSVVQYMSYIQDRVLYCAKLMHPQCMCCRCDP